MSNGRMTNEKQDAMRADRRGAGEENMWSTVGSSYQGNLNMVFVLILCSRFDIPELRVLHGYCRISKLRRYQYLAAVQLRPWPPYSE
jgi:hypothetical protein